VDEASLRAKGLLRRHYLLKLLGDGAIDRKLTIKVHAASVSAKEKVAKAGGTIEIIPTKEIEVKVEVKRDMSRAPKSQGGTKPDAPSDVQPKGGAKAETKPAPAQSKPKAPPETGKK
ncbi:MAG TPA: uL15m family ribosomal protein, partial [Planctomycetota bacterium]|nr:uL15m family ribosomal protein [Planctomycetota bacterium]